jgi:hypothetical protein
MELKVVCDCGQKYKFDVEPAGGRMPFAVNCPVCNADGTAAANALLVGRFSAAGPPAALVPPPPPAPPEAGGLGINLEAHAPAASEPPPSPVAAAAIPPLKALAAAKPAKTANCNLGLGIAGAVLGAGVGAGLMYGFFLLAEFRFPLLGTGIGALAGLGARLLGRGSDATLGIITGVIALVAVGGTLYFMYHSLPPINILSMIVSVSVAYKVASR